VSAPRRSLKFLRFSLIGLGALFVISALANVAAAWVLIEPADEQSLGITRNEILGWYGSFFVSGLALITLGLRRK